MDSKSEAILQAVALRLGSLPWCKHVARLFLSDSVAFDGLGSSQLPAIIMDERLPLPMSWAGSPQRMFTSSLGVPLWVFLPVKEGDQPRTVRQCLGDLFSALMDDPTWGGLAKDTKVDPEKQAPPVSSGVHVEFGILVTITYKHFAYNV